MKTFSRIRKRSGFTLLEMMLVLLILSLILTFGVAARISMLMDKNKDNTLATMKTIQQQLIRYRDNPNSPFYGSLPCPALETDTVSSSTYGWAQAPCNSGGMVKGAVPTETLGLPNEDMYDAYGRRFHYYVWSPATASCFFKNNPIPYAGGGITIYDGNGTALANQITALALYAIVSPGRQGHGGYLQSGAMYTSGSTNAGVQANCWCTGSGAAQPSVYLVDASLTPSNNGVNNGFDNLVVYAEREQILSAADMIPGTIESCAR